MSIHGDGRQSFDEHPTERPRKSLDLDLARDLLLAGCSVAEVATRLGVCRVTIYSRLRDGRLPRTKPYQQHSRTTRIVVLARARAEMNRLRETGLSLQELAGLYRLPEERVREIIAGRR